MGFLQKHKKIDWFEFISEYLDVKFENNKIKEEFDNFVKKTRIENPTDNQFEEFIIFNLFIDYAIFLKYLSKEKAQLLYETLEENMVAKLIMAGYKIDTPLFIKKVEIRFDEYLPCLEEFTQENLKKWDVKKHFGSRLGKKFVENFTGKSWEENPLLVYPATWLFLTKVIHIGKLLEDIEVIF